MGFTLQQCSISSFLCSDLVNHCWSCFFWTSYCVLSLLWFTDSHQPPGIFNPLFIYNTMNDPIGLVWFDLWCLTPLSTIVQSYRGVSFIGGGNRSTRRKPPTCIKSPLNPPLIYICYLPWHYFCTLMIIMLHGHTQYSKTQQNYTYDKHLIGLQHHM